MVRRPHRDRSGRHALTTSSEIRGRGARILLAAASVVYLLWVASLTLGPQPEGAGGVLLWAADLFARSPVTSWLTFDVLEFLANVVLFVPLGVLWVLWTGTRRWWLAVPVGFAMSAGIEAAQLLWLEGRFADGRDLISNTLGAAGGAALCAGFLMRLARRRRAVVDAARARS